MSERDHRPRRPGRTGIPAERKPALHQPVPKERPVADLSKNTSEPEQDVELSREPELPRFVDLDAVSHEIDRFYRAVSAVDKRLNTVNETLDDIHLHVEHPPPSAASNILGKLLVFLTFVGVNGLGVWASTHFNDSGWVFLGFVGACLAAVAASATFQD